MAENKMEQVAAMFGKTLGEEFIINEHPSRYYFLYIKKKEVTVFDPKIGWTTKYESECNAPDFHHVKVKITKNGLFQYNEWKNYWQQDELTLSDLLTGKAVIVDD